MAFRQAAPNPCIDNAGQSPAEPVRLLATAYDSQWRMKNVVPPGAIPTSRSPSPVARSPQKWGSASPKRQVSPKKPLALGIDASSKGRASKYERDSCSSPKSPTSPNSRKNRHEALGTLNLLMVGADGADKPSSARSETEEQKKKHVAQKPENSDDEREEKPLAGWAEEAGVPLDLAQHALDAFVEFVSNPGPPKHKISKEKILFGTPFDAGIDLGSMDDEHFGKACCRIADCKSLEQLPDGFLIEAMHSADKDGSGDIDFGEFLYFYYKFSFSEEVLIGPDERLIRAAAREHAIPYDEIGKYKYIFDQTDTNRNGRICFDEFKILINKLLKIPRGEELPVRRFKDMWREANRQSSDSDINFLQFVGWYKKYFLGNDDPDESPFEAYYHNIRRISVYDSNAYH